MFGGSTSEDCHPLVLFRNMPVLDIRSSNREQPHLWFYCEDTDGQPAIEIQNGEWLVGTGAYRFTCDSQSLLIMDHQQASLLLHLSLLEGVGLTGSFCIMALAGSAHVAGKMVGVIRAGTTANQV